MNSQASVSCPAKARTYNLRVVVAMAALALLVNVAALPALGSTAAQGNPNLVPNAEFRGLTGAIEGAVTGQPPTTDFDLNRAALTAGYRHWGELWIRSGHGGNQGLSVGLPLYDDQGVFLGIQPGTFGATAGPQWELYAGPAFTGATGQRLNMALRLAVDDGENSIEIALPRIVGPIDDEIFRDGFEGQASQPGPSSCPGPIPSEPESGLCRTVPAPGPALLVQSDLLLPDGELRNAQLLIGGDGLIACLACDCSAHPQAGAASRLECPGAVVSPGLVDAQQFLTFSRNFPWVPPDPEERYAHRHEWRIGPGNSTQITALPSANGDQMLWAEMRSIMAGVTSMVGSGWQTGFVRNLNYLEDAQALGAVPVRLQTFPLGDSNGVTRTEDCAYPSFAPWNPSWQLTQLVAEGIDVRARNEFRCLSGQADDGINTLPNSAIFGGIALTSSDLALLRDAGGSLVWQPRHQVSVYGMTAPVTAALALGLPVGLGTYWPRTGSMHLGRELACARSLDQNHFDGVIGDERLWAMATSGSAATAGMSHLLGGLEAGRVADLLMVPRRGLGAHEAVVTAESEDVALVMRSGVAIYGNVDLIESFDSGAQDCDLIEVCGASKLLCVSRETEGAHTLATLASAAGETSGPLFYCGVPTNEPTCVPARTAPFPYPALNNDLDGDGVPDDVDNCPAIFNPPRPIDGGVQADSNGNGIGDACDPCPLGKMDPLCSTL